MSKGHFIGSIVYIDTGIYQVTGANPIEVIDGQQRLTTISLLLLALARALEVDGDDAARRRASSSRTTCSRTTTRTRVSKRATSSC